MGVVSIFMKGFVLLALLMGPVKVSSEDDIATRITPSYSPTQSPSQSQSQPPVISPSQPQPPPSGQAPSPFQTPPAPPVSPSPTVSPSPPQAPSPTLPTRRFVAVQGVVYCKPCKFTGVQTLLGASPLTGAVVRLQCQNSRTPRDIQATTDKNGYFFIHGSNMLTNYGAHKCRVVLVSSPATCNVPTDLHQGRTGAYLRRQESSTQTQFALYTVGPFAFEQAADACHGHH